MPDYSKSKIYKIQSASQPDVVYYGSTTQKYLSTRMADHRATFKRGEYRSSHEILKRPDAKIILVENFPCASKDELLKREYEYIQQNNCVNSYTALNVDLNQRNYLREYNKKRKLEKDIQN